MVDVAAEFGLWLSMVQDGIGRRREMSRLRKELAQTFVDEPSLSLAEVERSLGVSTSGIARSLSR